MRSMYVILATILDDLLDSSLHCRDVLVVSGLNMRLAFYSTASALCVTVFQECCELGLVLVVDGLRNRSTVLALFARQPF